MKRLFQRSKKTVSKPGSRLHRLRLLSRRPVMIPVMVIGGLALASLISYFVFFQKDGQPIAQDSAFVVIISHDKQVETVPSRQQTVGELLAKMDITLNKGDVVEPNVDTQIHQDDFRINIYRAAPVEVIDGGRRQFTFSAATTPRSVAQQVGYELYPEDGVTAVPVTNFLKQGSISEQVVIDRSVPIFLNLYGTPLEIRTHADTVEELLKEKGLSLASNDQVLPKPSTPIKAKQQIFVTRKGTKIKSIVKPLAMPVKTVEDNRLAYGIRVVRQEGAPGKQVITYQIDKKTKLRKIIQKVTVVSPVKQIVAIGTNLSGSRGDVMRAGISASDYMYVDYIIQHESNWNPAAMNAGGCAGLGQACPGSKLAAVCPDWQVDPICQLRFFDNYAQSRYGSWYSAYIFKRNHGWW